MSPKSDLVALARCGDSGLISVDSARRALNVATNAAATRRLATLERLGFLVRARRGLYLLLPLGASRNSATVEDAWVLAARLFAPCYIGGWSGAEHWGLTEQLFRSTFVATGATIRRTQETVLSAEFQLARVAESRLRGTTLVWRGTERVAVSGPERTIVDAARDPSWIGGVRHLSDIITEYSRRPTADPTLLADTLREFGNGAAAKRLGFLLEMVWPERNHTIAVAADMISAGVIKLDPAVRSRGKLLKRWGLWVNSNIKSP